MWKICQIWGMSIVNGQVEEINDAYKDILEEMGELEWYLEDSILNKSGWVKMLNKLIRQTLKAWKTGSWQFEDNIKGNFDKVQRALCAKMVTR